MADFYISDVTGNFDYQPYLDTLREAKTIPLQQMQSDQTLMQAKQQALDAVKAKVDAVITPLETLDESDTYDALKAKVGNSGIASATVSSAAAEGEYALETVSLAKANTYKIGTIASIDDAGTAITQPGTLTIHYNADGTATSLAVDYENKSLEDIVDAINADENLKASLVNLGDSGGYQLLVSAANTGTGNAITGVDDSLNLGLDLTGIFSENSANTYETVSASDAKIKLGGIEFTGDTNAFENILTGVSITAKEVGETTLSIVKDHSAVKSALKSILDAYNGLVDTVRAATGEGGVLAGESSLHSITNTVFHTLSDKLGAYGLLQTVGTAETTKGHLELDETALDNFVQGEDYQAVLQNFSDLLQTRMEGYSTSLERREQSYQRRMEEIDTRLRDMSERIDSEIETMRMKFTKLQLFLTEMQDVQSRITSFTDSYTSSSS